VVRHHLVFGWVSLLVFALLGVALESMHGFKIGWYLDVGNETRRLLLTLAHAHGVLIALVNLGFAATLRSMAEPSAVPGIASPCLLSAGVLMPAGFLLGGLVVYDGDPGLGIFLLPIGAALLVVGIAAAARGVLRGG
jgi:hypothetical protein